MKGPVMPAMAPGPGAGRRCQPTEVLAWCLAAVLVLAGSVAAAEPGGGVTWAGGRLSLAEAVAVLNKSGNPTHLVPGADASRQVMLPAFRCSYWQAVLLVARSFELELRAPARTANPSHDQELRGEAIAIGHGPLELADRRPRSAPRPGAPTGQDLAAWLHQRSRTNAAPAEPVLEHRACGPYLLTLVETAALAELSSEGERHRVGVTWRARLEPSLNEGTLGASWLRWTAVWGGVGEALSLPLGARQDLDEMDRWRLRQAIRNMEGRTDNQRPAPILTLLDDLPGAPRRLMLQGELRTRLMRKERLDLLLVPGQRRSIQFLGRTVTIALTTATQAQAAGSQAGVSLEFADGSGALFQSGEGITVGLRKVGGRTLRSTGNDLQRIVGNLMTYSFHFDAITDELHLASLSAEVADAQLSAEISIPLAFP